MKSLAWAILLVALVAAWPVAAREAAFVRADELDSVMVLPDPPAPESDETKAELAELHRIEQARTPAEVVRAQADDAEQSIFIFQDVLGPAFVPDNVPLTAALSQRVHNDEAVVAGPAKRFWQRARPFTLDPTLKPVCKLAKDQSYPSGHTVSGFMEALVLAAMVPEKRQAILVRAEEYAHNRLVCGVHFPSDLEAAKRLAYGINALMMNDAQFRKEFAPAKAELRKALGLS